MERWGVVFIVLTGLGCTQSQGLLPEGFPPCTTAATCAAEVAGSADPTWWTDVKPIFDAKCATCHIDGDIGFPLNTYNEVFGLRAAVRAAVEVDQMPPWQPDNCCADYIGDRSLTKAQKDTVLSWIDTGAAEGDPALEGPPLPNDEVGLERVDATLAMAEPFLPQATVGADEIRCFLLEGWSETDTKFVTGLNVQPGNRSIVHHVIVYMVDADDIGAARQLEAEDGRPGWDCYGFAGVGLTPTGAVGGWTPGSVGYVLPDAIGREVPAGTAFVLNVHYDTGAADGNPDQTIVEFQLEDTVSKEARGMAVANPLWLAGDAMKIEAGDPDAMVYFAYDPTVLFNKRKPFKIYGANIHMHELGSRATIAILRDNGDTDCLLHIGDFDFDWLGDYGLEEPVVFNPGDRLYVECHWDNTDGNQKVVNGKQLDPKDLAWGTDFEMCAGLLLVTDL